MTAHYKSDPHYASDYRAWEAYAEYVKARGETPRLANVFIIERQRRRQRGTVDVQSSAIETRRSVGRVRQ